MTEDTTRQTEGANRAMKNVDHTHPDTGRPFGEQVVFARGPTVAADGGERREPSPTSENERSESPEREHGVVDKEDEPDEVETEDEQMKDVDHEPPNEAEANRVFERGREGRDGDR